MFKQSMLICNPGAHFLTPNIEQISLREPLNRSIKWKGRGKVAASLKDDVI